MIDVGISTLFLLLFVGYLLSFCMNSNTNFYLRSFILCGLFVVPFIPLVISPALFFPFISGKGFAFRIIVEIIFALWLILALRDSEYRPRVSHILTGVLFFISVLFVANIFGVAPYKSFWSNFERMEGFMALLHHFLYFLVAGAMLTSERLWSFFFHTSIGVSLFLGFYALMQISGELVINQGGVRVDGTFGNAAYFAAYLLVHIFLLLFYLSRERLSRAGDILGSVAVGAASFLAYYGSHIAKQGSVAVGNVGGTLMVGSLILLIGSVSLYVTSRRTIWSVRYLEPAIYLLLILLNVFLLMKTATRGAILALTGGALLTALLIALCEKRNTFVRKVGIGAVVGVCAVAGLFFLVRDTEFVRTDPVLSRVASISLSEGMPRFTIWSIGLKAFIEHPVLGYGQENFNYAFNTYYEPRMYAQEQWFDRAHNIFFDWLVASGLLGLFAYLSLYVYALWFIWKRDEKNGLMTRLLRRMHIVPDNSFSNTEKSILTGLFVGLLFQNIFVFDNIGTYILFFSLLAYLHTQHSVPLSDRVNQALMFRPEFINRVVTPIIIVGLVCGLYFINIKPIQAGSMLIDALKLQGQGKNKEAYELFERVFAKNTFATGEAREQMVQVAINIVNDPSADVSLKQEYFNLAKDQLELQLNRVPNDARYNLFMGYLLNRSRQSQEAISFLERAIELSPKKQTMYFELGSAYLSMGANEKAYEIFKKAYDFDTHFKEAAIFAAAGALYVGKKDETLAILNQTYGTTVVDDDRLVKALFDRQQWDMLMPILEQRIKNEPQNPQFRINAAAAYLQMNQRQKAVNQLTTILSFEGMNDEMKAVVNGWISDIKAGKNPQ